MFIFLNILTGKRVTLYSGLYDNYSFTYYYCHGGEPHYRLEDWDVFSWPIASFSARQGMLGLTGCPCSRQSTSNTTDESQKMMVSTLPADHST
jgi:hypothetical protein